MALKYEKIKNGNGPGLLGKLWSCGLFTVVLFFGAVMFGLWMTKQEILTKAQQNESQKSKARMAELQSQLSAMKKSSDDLRAGLKAKADAINATNQEIQQVRDGLERSLASMKKNAKAKAQAQKLISESVEKVTALQKQNQGLIEELVAAINPPPAQ